MRTAAALTLLLSLSLPLFARTFVVFNTNDSGPGSLRQAIEDVNASRCAPSDRCEIAFAIDGPVPPSGWFTIAPQSPLPVIEGPSITIDGSTQTTHTGETNPHGPEIELDGTHAGYRSGIKAFATSGFIVQGLAINRFEGHGIFVEGSSSPIVSGNYVGVDPTGTVALPNGFNGIAFHTVSHGRIDHNLVSGNAGNGIYAVALNGVSIDRNRVGVARSSDHAIPNGASGIDARGVGIFIQENVIAHNELAGVGLDGNVELYDNAIYGNGVLGVLHWNGSPAGSQTPVLISAVESSETSGYYTGFPTVSGRVRSTPNTRVSIAAYAAPSHGDGRPDARIMIGQADVTTDANGDAAFTTERSYFTSRVIDLFGGYVTATATPEGGATSRFSTAIPLTMTTPQFEVTSTADAGPGSLREAITHVNATDCTVRTPCRITFNFPANELTDSAARIVVAEPLPPIRGYVRMNGDSQAWWHGATNADGPEVEIRGGAGVQFGTESDPVIRAFVRSIVFNGSSSDGLTIHASPEDVMEISQPRIEVIEVYSGTDIHGTAPVPNNGNGLRLVGGTATALLFRSNAEVTSSIFSWNRQNGILLGGDMHTIRDSSIGQNEGHGIYVTGGTQQVLAGNSIAWNAGDGVATAPGVRAPSMLSSVQHNGGHGIDVHDDGAVAADGNQEDGTIDPPVLQRAWYDASQDATFVEGIAIPESRPVYPEAGGARDAFATIPFINSAPDPSGHGEGETVIPSMYPVLVVVEGDGGAFRIGIRGDFRGKWFTATTNRFYCYYEAGCSSRESSEFSNAVPVE